MNSPLWAPWRIKYILSQKDKTRCVFCSAAKASKDELRDQGVLLVREHAFVILNKFPFNSGHLMVIPRRHVSGLDELTAEEHAGLWDLTRIATLRLKQALHAQGINLGMNLGEVAGAGIAEHIHVHLVPRWLGDTNFMPVIADVRVMPQHLDETWCHLYPHFEDLEGLKAKAP